MPQVPKTRVFARKISHEFTFMSTPIYSKVGNFCISMDLAANPYEQKGDAIHTGVWSGAGSTPVPNRWTFLTNHVHVLIALHANPDLVLREVVLQVGITERGVQRIVQDLEDEGFIRREKVGRKNHYQVLTQEPLRHPLEAHRKIGDLLKLIARKPIITSG